jgi:hypothetical protein
MIEQIRRRLTAAGRATDAEIAEHLAGLDADVDLATSPMISAGGVKGP